MRGSRGLHWLDLMVSLIFVKVKGSYFTARKEQYCKIFRLIKKFTNKLYNMRFLRNVCDL